MNMPFALPDWVPWWVPMVLLVPTLLYALAFLFMPFSVLGTKTRLELMEARLEEMQQELRMIAARLPLGREMDFEDVYAPVSQIAARGEPSMSSRPPVPPPAPHLYDDDDDTPVERPAPPPNMRPVRRQEPAIVRPQRAEPQLSRRR